MPVILGTTASSAHEWIENNKRNPALQLELRERGWNCCNRPYFFYIPPEGRRGAQFGVYRLNLIERIVRNFLALVVVDRIFRSCHGLSLLRHVARYLNVELHKKSLPEAEWEYLGRLGTVFRARRTRLPGHYGVDRRPPPIDREGLVPVPLLRLPSVGVGIGLPLTPHRPLAQKHVGVLERTERDLLRRLGDGEPPLRRERSDSSAFTSLSGSESGDDEEVAGLTKGGEIVRGEADREKCE
jgi:hypothetical protein